MLVWADLRAQAAAAIVPTASQLLLANPPIQPSKKEQLGAINALKPASSAQSKPGTTEPLPVEIAFVLSAKRQNNQVSIQFDVAENYYLYKEKISVKAVRATVLTPIVLPAGIIKYDDTFAKNVETYRTQLQISPFKTTEDVSAPVVIDVYSQGCADIGICYPPQLQRLSFAANSSIAAVSTLDYVTNSVATATQPSVVATESLVPLQNSNNVTKWLASSNLFVLIVGFISFGLLLSFTPCVLPMVPIVSAIVLGRGNSTKAVQDITLNTAFSGFKLSLAYVLGMCVTYTVIGVLAGLAGAGLNAFLQHPIVLTVFGLLMVCLAGAQFGWYELSLPEAWMNKISHQQNKTGRSRYIGIVFMGALSAIMVGPCVTAPLAGALAYIAQTGDAWTGGVALFSLAFGMGIPLLLIGAGGVRWLPKTGAWMNHVTYAFGIMLLSVAIWMVQSLLAPWVLTLLWVCILLLITEILGTFQLASATSTRLSRLAKLAGLLCIVWAVAVVWGMTSGRFDVLRPLDRTTSNLANRAGEKQKPTFKVISSQALESELLSARGKPVIVDIYADWCVSCIEFERFTFNNEKVAPLLEQFTLLKVDTTQNTIDDRALLKKLTLFGPPAILFYTPKGQELDEARVIGFQAAEPFSQHLKQLLSANR